METAAISSSFGHAMVLQCILYGAIKSLALRRVMALVSVTTSNIPTLQVKGLSPMNLDVEKITFGAV
ncbi:hypothetical protein HO173_008642 [Letharia columbiana]|uniref:Uncharacterized protein n=1 Tax=Letharia columbiana TaxID=112416 RepID=A0A8H6L2J5_9LECA|nr:uncharacterized protein HO173_008642 [Letharia columbiana]KAF6233098.1 hypothetical protein HO173_008642 [Letharia columbiana]